MAPLSDLNMCKIHIEKESIYLACIMNNFIHYDLIFTSKVLKLGGHIAYDMKEKLNAICRIRTRNLGF